MANKKSNKGHSKNAGKGNKNKADKAHSSGSKGGAFEDTPIEGARRGEKKKKK